MPRGSAAPSERLEAIEILLLWEGRVSRARLLELFPIHATVASRDIADYRASYPDACEVDLGSKSYTASPFLKPVLSSGKFRDYERLVGAVGDVENLDVGIPVESALAESPDITPYLFAAIHRAIRNGSALKITYRSLQNPVAHERIIRPHSLIQAGPRWHLRAYCADSEDFRDFNLGRISAVAQIDRELPGAAADMDWQTTVKVRLVPHRDLSAQQSKLVRDEYMGGTRALAFQVRVPMVKYVVQTYRAAFDPERERAPEHLLMVDDAKSLPTGAAWN